MLSVSEASERKILHCVQNDKEDKPQNDGEDKPRNDGEDKPRNDKAG